MDQVRTAAIATIANVMRPGHHRNGLEVRCVLGAGAGTSAGAPGLGVSGRSSAVDISVPTSPPPARCTTKRSCRPQIRTGQGATHDVGDRSGSPLVAAGSV